MRPTSILAASMLQRLSPVPRTHALDVAKHDRSIAGQSVLMHNVGGKLTELSEHPFHIRCAEYADSVKQARNLYQMSKITMSKSLRSALARYHKEQALARISGVTQIPADLGKFAANTGQHAYLVKRVEEIEARGEAPDWTALGEELAERWQQAVRAR